MPAPTHLEEISAVVFVTTRDPVIEDSVERLIHAFAADGVTSMECATCYICSYNYNMDLE